MDVYNEIMYFQHDSLDITYRRPQGAVKANEEVTLSVRTADIYGEVFLLLQDRMGERLLPMWPVGDRFTVRFSALEEPGLMFYGFLLRQDGREYYYCGSSGRGELREDRGELWQITVYDPDFVTPAWFRQAVAYQIFPDRFCRSERAPMAAGAAYHQRMGRKAFLHRDWAEEPLYGPHGGSRTYAPDDYFGGDLNGIREKLPYLEELGITCIYLNPIFEADSNHRYNTADYTRIDPLLGTEEDFRTLCAEAKERGIRIILDGVFSHTGADSRYFDKRNRYGNGAYHHTDSPYFSWYRFLFYLLVCLAYDGTDEVGDTEVLCAHAVAYLFHGDGGDGTELGDEVFYERGAGGGAELTLDVGTVDGDVAEDQGRCGGGHRHYAVRALNSARARVNGRGHYQFRIKFINEPADGHYVRDGVKHTDLVEVYRTGFGTVHSALGLRDDLVHVYRVGAYLVGYVEGVDYVG